MKKFSNSFDFKKNKSFKFESYGVKVEIKATEQELLEEIYLRVKQLIPNKVRLIENQNVDHIFNIYVSEKKLYGFNYNETDFSEHKSKEVLFNYLGSKIRLTIAEFAEKKVFIHAGVIAFDNKAIVIPASSYKGKTTLVKEFLRIGATYYSDEYAVLDENGFVYPFPKTLSIRGIIDDLQQVEFHPERFGAKIGITPIPVKMIVLTEFSDEAVWQPSLLKSGEGVLEIIQHTLPIRLRPKFTLEVLKKVASRAIICKSLRGEAEASVKKMLEFFELNA